MNITVSSMSKKNNYLAIIPARGGSKRLPGKNMLLIAGQSLLSWTIQAALSSSCFDQVFVNTDDESIAEEGKKWGATIPFLRPTELAGDQSTTMEVLTHMIDSLQAEIKYSHLVLLQPTSPLRSAEDIQQAIALFEQKDADAVISICRTEHSPLWSNTLPADANLENFIRPEIQKTPSQELPDYYRLNGAIYICDIAKMRQENSLFLKTNCYGYVMSRKNSIDIDDQVDFDLADIYLSRSKASI